MAMEDAGYSGMSYDDGYNGSYARGRSQMTGRKKKLLEMNEDNFYSAYWDVIDNRLGIRHLVPHTCRHYYFTQLTSAGVQGGIIAEVGGHADYATTMKNYVSIPLKDKIKAVNKIK